jgi:predicted membrane channel-forming protein YqfA (hemolysin III family)
MKKEALFLVIVMIVLLLTTTYLALSNQYFSNHLGWLLVGLCLLGTISGIVVYQGEK